MRYFAALGLAAILSACASLPAPVPLIADPEGIAMLEGTWSGEYWSPATGRSGSIMLMLETHADSTVCRGDVVMIPRGFNEPLPPVEGWSLGRTADASTPTVLRIQLLEVKGDHLSGTIEPYRDPDTGHAMSSTFEGIIEGDVMTGQLVTVDGQTSDRYFGEWRATRQKVTARAENP